MLLNDVVIQKNGDIMTSVEWFPPLESIYLNNLNGDLLI